MSFIRSSGGEMKLHTAALCLKGHFEHRLAKGRGKLPDSMPKALVLHKGQGVVPIELLLGYYTYQDKTY